MCRETPVASGDITATGRGHASLSGIPGAAQQQVTDLLAERALNARVT